MRVKEKTLQRVLDLAVLRELPKQYKTDCGFWIEAVLLVRKRNLQECYVLAKRNGSGIVSITNDPDGTSTIMGVIGTYPYTYLDYMGYDISLSDKAKKTFIKGLYDVAVPTDIRDRMKNATSEELDVIAREVLIWRQLKNKAEDVARNAMEEREATTYTYTEAEEMDDIAKTHGFRDKQRTKEERKEILEKRSDNFMFKE